MRLSDRLLRLAPLAWLVLLAGTVGCGGAEHDAMEKQLGELRGEIAGLRARQAALTERIDTLDVERNVARSAAASASAPGMVTMPHAAGPASSPGPAPPVVRAADRDRPDLDVVRLSPSEGDGDADNDPSRPVVRAAGSAGSAGDAAGSRASQTLNNKNLSSRPRKSVANAAPKKTDADARPVAKP